LIPEWPLSESREPAQRARDWRFLGLSSSALLIVLAAAGCSRYAAALQILATQAHHSLLSNVGVSDVSPIRDVLISLLANVAAWIVGVFVSYIAHDDDPDYASATRQWNKAHYAWARERKQFEQEMRHVQAKFTKTINDRRTAAKTRAASVETELNMFKQVEAHEQALNTEIDQAMRTNIAAYRVALTRALIGSGGRAQLVLRPANAPLSPFELTAMDLPVASAVQSLLAA
jgi:hypothetical protein